MESLNDFNLVFEIINNIIILNDENNIFFSGNEIKNLLCDKKKELKSSFLDNFSFNKDQTLWKNKIIWVRKNKKQTYFKSEKLKTTFYIFPMNFNGNSNIIISTDKNILQTNQIKHALKERVKELECMYNISYELDTTENFKKALKNSTHHLINGLQYPEIAFAHFEVDGIVYGDKECTSLKPKNILKEDIIVNKKKRGIIRVCYSKHIPFLKEEKKLLIEVSALISKIIEKKDLKIELEKYLGNLETLVKEKTKELEESKKMYQSLFSNAPDGIAISDFSGKIIKANRAFYEITKFPKNSDLHYIENKLYENATKIWPIIIKHLKKKKYLVGFELNLIDSEGNLIPFIGSFILVESKGNTNIEAIYKDIRFKKELEKNLIDRKNYLEKIVKERTSDLEKQKKILLLKNKKLLELTEKCGRGQQELKAFFNAITDTIIVVDPDFNITMSNEKEIGNKGKCYEKLFKKGSICQDCPAIKSFKTGKPTVIEKKEDNKYYLINTYPTLSNNGNVDKIIAICSNISKQKQMEFQLLQSYKLASLGKLVAGVAHEINNPNTFIRGNIKIIKESFSDIFPILDDYFEDHKDLTIARLKYDIFEENIPILIDDMVSGTNRIKKIVDELRNYAKKDEGLLTDDIKINNIINNSLRLIDNQIRQHASVELDLDPNIPKFKGNIQKMEQVIVNLLVNASQAIENGFGKIDVKTRFNEKLNHIMIKVKDNGKGMDEKTKKSIFDPFFTTKRNKGGTGLGLSISFRIIKEHSGRIEVNTKLNHGTTFRIYIPIKTMEQKKEEQ